MKRFAPWLAAGVLAVLVVPARPQSAEEEEGKNLQAQLAKLARGIKGILDTAKETQVVVEPFRSEVKNARVNGGLAFSQLLARELRNQSVNVVDKGARAVVRG